MGQKTSPKSFRLCVRKDWLSNWYANKEEFGRFLEQDRVIRKFMTDKLSNAGISKIFIKRMSGKIEVTLKVARPGVVIGKKGSDIDVLKKELRDLTGD